MVFACSFVLHRRWYFSLIEHTFSYVFQCKCHQLEIWPGLSHLAAFVHAFHIQSSILTLLCAFITFLWSSSSGGCGLGVRRLRWLLLLIRFFTVASSCFWLNSKLAFSFFRLNSKQSCKTLGGKLDTTTSSFISLIFRGRRVWSLNPCAILIGSWNLAAWFLDL